MDDKFKKQFPHFTPEDWRKLGEMFAEYKKKRDSKYEE
jgi:hypothetical protein